MSYQIGHFNAFSRQVVCTSWRENQTQIFCPALVFCDASTDIKLLWIVFCPWDGLGTVFFAFLLFFVCSRLLPWIWIQNFLDWIQNFLDWIQNFLDSEYRVKIFRMLALNVYQSMFIKTSGKHSHRMEFIFLLSRLGLSDRSFVTSQISGVFSLILPVDDINFPVDSSDSWTIQFWLLDHSVQRGVAVQNATMRTCVLISPPFLTS